MIKKKEVPQWKLDEVDNLVNLFKQYKNIAVIDVAHLNDKQIQETRKILRGKAIIRMSKKNLQIRAIEQFKKEAKNENLDELANSIPGQSALCFTTMDIFELKKTFNENEYWVPAKPDEITPVDIWVPAGDTGLPTGQVISELNMILRLPTRIQNDTIWIKEDTRTHGAGDFVDVKQAAVLKKLGITPIESLIKIHFAWSEGEIIPRDILYIDTEQFKRDITKAYREALGVLFEMPFYVDEMSEEYIRKAISEANTLNAMIFGEGIQVTAKKELKVEKEEAEEETEEEEVGIGGLFG
ncbi:MAG: 50S ribosomal protein L10 [Candidatus Lokiarchaeota archaeon]|nr:50S ribosomal protein L10 [Candidatus Lokiarchaeota archaeon]